MPTPQMVRQITKLFPIIYSAWSQCKSGSRGARAFPQWYSCRVKDGGLYIVALRLRRPRRVTIGALGRHRLRAGSYLYIGTARRGLTPRVRRHIDGPATRHWHIDHLTSLSDATALGAVVLPDCRLSECELNQQLATELGLTAPVPGFGASDCRAGCPAHLWYRAD